MFSVNISLVSSGNLKKQLLVFFFKTLNHFCWVSISIGTLMFVKLSIDGNPERKGEEEGPEQNILTK